MSGSGLPVRWLVAFTASCAASAAPAADFDCVTEPRQIAEVRSAVDGLIDRILVDRGDVVAAGQTVATLDSGLERANAELARFKATMHGALMSAENRLEYAKTKAARREQMSTDEFISAQDRDEAVAERRLAESQLVESRENQRLSELEYDRAAEQLRLRTVKAPVAGVVVERFMNPGELSDNRDQRRPIMKIADIHLLHVEALLPLEAVGRVAPGMDALVIPESPVGGRLVAKVRAVDKIIDAASGTFGVRLELPNPKLDIPAGIKCRVVFKDLVLDKVTTFDRKGAAKPPAATPAR
jgi:RND family efflux transporter MFP subunit